MCRCGKESRPGQRTCKECHASYIRERRRTIGEPASQKYKDIARSYTGVYKRRGKLQQKPCQWVVRIHKCTMKTILSHWK